MNEKSLCPDKGALRARLNWSTEFHCPVPRPKGNQGENWICALHRYANKQINNSSDTPAGAREGVMECSVCKVKLCAKCFGFFHTCSELDDNLRCILAK